MEPDEQLTPVVIREPNDEVREDFWPLAPPAVQQFADEGGKVYVTSALENGQAKYWYLTKRMWKAQPIIAEMLMRKGDLLSEEEQVQEIEKILDKLED